MRAVILILVAGMLMAMELPSIVGDHMVLQREQAVPVWGWDVAGAQVVVSFRGQQVEATTGQDGRWEASLISGAAGGPFELQISSGGESKTLSDVMVGEVWVAGGQSNMWWAVDKCLDFPQVKAAATDASIRFFDANTHPTESGWSADEPQRTVETEWSVCSPESVGSWAGTAYFFAQRLREELGVPVGIVHVAVPGRAVECFIRGEVMDQHFNPDLLAYAQDQATMPARKAAYEQATAAWKDGGKQGAKPKRPKGLQQPVGLWNGTVAPCVPFAAQGFIWWQGEANTARPLPYTGLFAAMVQDWREQWRMPDAPFYVDELANFGTRPGSPMQEAPWPALRDAQQQACAMLSNVYAVNNLDIMDMSEPGAPWQIHPRNKQLIGRRMAVRAMTEVYGKEQAVWRCPRVTEMVIEGAAVLLTVDQVGDGMKTSDGKEPRCFAICGADRQWHAATVTLDNDRIRVESSAVSEPVAVRYGWANNPDINVVNSAGLPLAQWRSDSWMLWPR